MARLDQELVERGLVKSRSRARDAILRGCVMINSEVATKPGTQVQHHDNLHIHDPANTYVSRAALKLLHGLEHFKMDVRDKHCLDIGASTGGFTQVLLERGARFVDALDVGHGQLDESLQHHERVHMIESQNARDLERDHLTHIPEFIVSDVSFISLKLALPPALQLATSRAQGIFLFKPQFEVGKEHLNAHGLVKDETLMEQSLLDFEDWFAQDPDWKITAITASPVLGGKGAKEFLIGAEKG